MLPCTANGDSRLSLWLRVREFAVPPSMIETATARRRAGDWAGACAAAGVDLDLDLRSVARTHGRELAARVRADLRRLAPDLLRWHLPRIAPDGLLRPGLTLTLARYGDDATGPPHLVVRTPPAWADGGQRISLALWDGTRRDADARRHPHPRPSRWFRLDLHRHLWDAGRSGELRARSGADRPPADGLPPIPDLLKVPDPLELLEAVPEGRHCAVDRWAAEAAILLHAEGRTTGPVTVRIGSRHRLALHLDLDVGLNVGLDPDSIADTPRIAPAPTDGGATALPVLPDAATWVLPDLELLRTGSIDADQLHPLVAAALVPDGPRPRPQPDAPARMLDQAREPHLVECRGAHHRIGLVDGVLAPLDHDPTEIRREELLVALTGTPLPCLQAIDEAHRHPDCLTGVRERLIHGDTAGALAVVEGLLGPDAVLRGGALRDELRAAAERRLAYGLFRAGLTGPGPQSGRFYPGLPHPRIRHHSRPRHTTGR
ncbi:hypothetical protein ACFWP5_49075 [Streptomyces sp. NPDC058469]|uniref:hypothetical protein n=1 Tax=Streptomyces sp. NPDC058469 TaxID=3346514 RepID=UPI003656C448